MFLHVLRALFIFIVVSVAWSFIAVDDDQTSPLRILQLNKEMVLIAVVVLGLAVIAVDMLISQKSLLAISGLFFGVIVGMVIAFGLSMIIDLGVQSLWPELRQEVHADAWIDKPQLKTDEDTGKPYVAIEKVLDKQFVGYRDHPFISTLKIVMGVMCCYLAVSFIYQTKDDVRFVIPYVEFAKDVKGNRPLLLDSSVIIDGRIADICATHVIETELIVPRFILQELQLISDSADRLKRNRGRRGLDILNQMQTAEDIDVRIMDVEMARKDIKRTVDEMLVELAVDIGGRVATNDYNLNKVAQLRGITVININDLANALKPVFLPGEQMKIKVIRPGEEAGQGVGYLEDGTMVVVEGGRDAIGKMVDIAVTSALQTSAGRMIFGRVESNSASTSASGKKAPPKRETKA
ncbi:MAG: PIN/TRAM domain-containing protein [Phycisphaerae bacterium]|nr:MAG: PIN/TRAM domain-containing protein [Phycisphaerae bacterium]